jgi:hypothetical protein
VRRGIQRLCENAQNEMMDFETLDCVLKRAPTSDRKTDKCANLGYVCTIPDSFPQRREKAPIRYGMYNFQKLSETTSLIVSVAIIPRKIAFLFLKRYGSVFILRRCGKLSATDSANVASDCILSTLSG